MLVIISIVIELWSIQNLSRIKKFTSLWKILIQVYCVVLEIIFSLLFIMKNVKTYFIVQRYMCNLSYLFRTQSRVFLLKEWFKGSFWKLTSNKIHIINLISVDRWDVQLFCSIHKYGPVRDQSFYLDYAFICLILG